MNQSEINIIKHCISKLKRDCLNLNNDNVNDVIDILNCFMNEEKLKNLNDVKDLKSFGILNPVADFITRGENNVKQN